MLGTPLAPGPTRMAGHPLTRDVSFSTTSFPLLPQCQPPRLHPHPGTFPCLPAPSLPQGSFVSLSLPLFLFSFLSVSGISSSSCHSLGSLCLFCPQMVTLLVSGVCPSVLCPLPYLPSPSLVSRPVSPLLFRRLWLITFPGWSRLPPLPPASTPRASWGGSQVWGL